MTEFNVGDVVRFTGYDFSNGFTEGKLYIVREYPTRYDSLGVVEDDKGSNTNGFAPEFFELVRRKAEFRNHELTVNEAHAIADEVNDSILTVIGVYDVLIKQGFKITKD